MNFTAKSRYALKIMIDLAMHQGQGPQTREAISARQHVPLDFMDQITARLRAKSLIKSLRGRRGGFELLREPHLITLWDVFAAVEDHLHPVKCLHTSCSLVPTCNAYDAWNDVFSFFQHGLEERNLAMILKSSRHNLRDLRPRPLQ
jgi:Rrf2 family iron-sulfur cluster assembly transcriptional regulator